MEDDKLKDFFEGFQPRLTSDTQFINRLQRKLDAVEIVKEQNRKVLRHSRIAIVVAAVAGFVSGAAMTLIYPTLNAWLSSITISLPHIGLPDFAVDGQITSWLIIATICVTIAINAYELTLSRLSLSKSNEK